MPSDEIRTIGDALVNGAIVTATCNNPRCQHSSEVDLLAVSLRLGEATDLGVMRRKLRCQACGSGAIIAVLPKDWGNLQGLWKNGRRLSE